MNGRSVFEASGIGSFLPAVAAIVLIGILVAAAIVMIGGRRVTGRSGDTEAFEAQLEAQIYATRGWRRRRNTPAWDGEDRLGMPTDLTENGL